MNKYTKIALTGLLISFLGSLPFGTLNITAFNIAVTQNINDAILFAFAVVFIELLAVLLTLKGANKINFKSKIFYYVSPLAIILLLYLAVSSFVTASYPEEMNESSHLFPMIQSPILLGLLLSVLNPLHIPFWMGWNTVLIGKGLLENSKKMHRPYMAGIAVGSIGAYFIFIFSGSFIFKNYQEYNYIIAFILGLLYLGFSFYLSFLFFKNHLKLKTDP
ncbi:MAG: LysE family transporter [Flavobacteriaceae bacterium]